MKARDAARGGEHRALPPEGPTSWGTTRFGCMMTGPPRGSRAGLNREEAT